jgi:hypothetical protein
MSMHKERLVKFTKRSRRDCDATITPSACTTALMNSIQSNLAYTHYVQTPCMSAYTLALEVQLNTVEQSSKKAAQQNNTIVLIGIRVQRCCHLMQALVSKSRANKLWKQVCLYGVRIK